MDAGRKRETLMKHIEFQDKNGSFIIHDPENYSGLYLPLAGEKGLKSSITPIWEVTAKQIRIISFLSL